MNGTMTLMTAYKEFVLPKLNPGAKSKIINAMRKILSEDIDVDDDTIVEPIQGLTKQSLMTDFGSYEATLTGLLLYVLKYTDNTGNKNITKIINEDYCSSEMHKPVLSSSSTDKTRCETNISEEDKMAAKKFCILYEEDSNLFILCQIAEYVDPLHKHVNNIFTDYILLSEAAKSEVMRLKNIPILEFEPNWEFTYLNKFHADIDKYELSHHEFLYDNGKYFHLARECPSAGIADLNPCIFPVLMNKILMGIPRKPTDLCDYIEDYIYLKEHGKGQDIEAPMDYMWNNLNLAGCPTLEMIFLVNRFIISACYVLPTDKERAVAWMFYPVPAEDDLYHNMECFYYYALLVLHEQYS